MSRKRKVKDEKVVFTECEKCGGYPAMWRWFNGKVLCSDCATSEFKKYLAALVLCAAVVLGLCL